MVVKFPKIPHLPWSESSTEDDRTLNPEECLRNFTDQYVIVTEKMDGENITLYHDYIHARSPEPLNSHPSHSYMKLFYDIVKNYIPYGIRITGEYLFAKHSIYYTDLPSYFMVFSVADEEEYFAWHEVMYFCDKLNLVAVPTIYMGMFDRDRIHEAWLNYKPDVEKEGYVVRVYESFKTKEFPNKIAKFVRKGHVSSTTHWSEEKLIRNKLSTDHNWI